MLAAEIISTIKDLDFPAGEHVVFGGGCLALRDIREASDLDLFVTKEVFDKSLANNNWACNSFNGRNPHLIGQLRGVEVQLFSEWDKDEAWQPDIRGYLERPEFVRGIACMPLAELLEWKGSIARPKDIRDIRLVNNWQ